MSEPLWTIKVRRVSPITGKAGWRQVLHGAGMPPPTWPTREAAARVAIIHYGFNDGRSKIVAVGGAP